jgi:hypothetical protein
VKYAAGNKIAAINARDASANDDRRLTRTASAGLSAAEGGIATGAASFALASNPIRSSAPQLWQ